MHSCSSVGDCELPRSVCDGAQSLVFYTDASCTAGLCAWQQQTMMCIGGCVNGGCSLSTTTASGPPLNMSGKGGTAGDAAGGTAGAAARGVEGGNSGEAGGGAGAGG